MAIKFVEKNIPPGRQSDSKLIIKFLKIIAAHLDHDDEWTIELHKQTKSKNRFLVRHFDQSEVLIRVCPGDSGTCWECTLKTSKTATFLVGRELSLWNGFDGHNIPDAFKANTGIIEEIDEPEEVVVAPALKVVEQSELSIMDRLANAEQIAKSFRERAKAITAGEAKVFDLMTSAERAQFQVDALKKQHADDVQGKAACDAIDAVSRLFAIA